MSGVDQGVREGGRRVTGRARPRAPGKPLVSVITIVRNGEAYLAETLQSVVEQTYENIELVVVDGRSTDATLDVIAAFEDRIDYWRSEADKGIYDAMNKGVGLASGEWICFMNAGDMFHDPDVVENVFAATPADADLVYGACEVDYGGFRRRIDAGVLDDLWRGMIFSHQSLFARATLLRSSPFDLGHGMAADFGFVVEMREQGRRFHRTPVVISTVSAHGVSDARRIETLRSTASIAKAYGLTPARRYFARRIALETFKAGLKRALGERLVRLILRYRPS